MKFILEIELGNGTMQTVGDVHEAVHSILGPIDYQGYYRVRDGGGQPGLWCQWIPTDDGTAIVWDEGEKFYNYKEWIEYLIQHFLAPWGYVLNGVVQWAGESRGDIGLIKIVNNDVQVLAAKVVYEPSEVV